MPPLILLAVPVCLLARLILVYRLRSANPVLADYYLEILGLMFLILAAYRLSGFAVQAGRPRIFSFYAEVTAVLALSMLADGAAPSALLTLGGALALTGSAPSAPAAGRPSGLRSPIPSENTERPPFGSLFAYDWEDWMKRSFVSCKY